MFKPLPAKFDFPAAEKGVLEFWDRHDVFAATLSNRAGAPRFVFYEGPPTANGMPHPGHCLTRAIKDLFPRYQTMCGKLVERKAGWDTHGLPVEREVEKELMAAGEMQQMGKAGIEAYGVEKFVHKCIHSVWKYTREWEEMTRRLGYWIDLPNAYVTYHQSYVESVWWSLKTLFERGLLYQAHKVVWWWAQGGTALSSGEVGEGYRTVDDPSVFVKFPLLPGSGQKLKLPENTSLLVWTTTPWTLISNHFAAVHPELEYALVEDPGDEHHSAEHLIIAKELVEAIGKKVKRELTPKTSFLGSELLNCRYVPPFQEPYYTKPTADFLERYHCIPLKDLAQANSLMGLSKTLGDRRAYSKDDRLDMSATGRFIGWTVLAAEFVSTDSGTGLVHEAPAFGEVDFELLQAERKNFRHGYVDVPVLCAVAPNGTFNDDAPAKYRNRFVKDCDKDIIHELKHELKTPWGTPLLFHQEQIRHEYPFCPRAENDPLIQYARQSWFVRTSQFKDEFLENNDRVNWLPDHIKEGRFGDFLRNNVDWALSRERFWGTPLPIWRCEKTGQMEAIGSFSELQTKPGATDATPEYPQGFWNAKVAEHAAAGDAEMPTHLRVHKPYIDAWTYDSPFVPGAKMKRVPEVIDCWWDAGSMPFAQWGYPHAPGSEKTLAERLPADFISEAIDQTRGWFYGLLSISTLLFGPGNLKSKIQNQKYPLPFKTCIVLGLIAGEDGNKMSKRLRNYREPSYIFDSYGADAMRWYFFSAQAPWTSVRFQEAAIRDSHREFLVKLYNVLSFFSIYASIDGFDPRRRDEPGNPMGWRPTAQRGELDRWIVTELHNTVASVRASMDRFENFPAAQKLSDLVEALSNWYVRRSRDRFWRPVEAKSERGTQNAEGKAKSAQTAATSASAHSAQASAFSPSDQDKWDAYHTLYGCLLTLSQAIAPFTPFFAETMYGVLTGSDGATERRSDEGKVGGSDTPSLRRSVASSLSVHLCDYPTPEEIGYCDDELAGTMDTVRDLVALGRSARTAAKLKVRQPLPRVEIVLTDKKLQAALEAHDQLIAEELNVKKVEFTTEADHYVSYKVVPNFKALGPKFGPLAPKIAGVLKQMSDASAARRELVDTGELKLTVDGQSVAVTQAELEIRLEAKPGWSAAQGRAGVVVLATEVPPELREEGQINELIHHVQTLRKEQNLPYEARIGLHIAASPTFWGLVRKFATVLQSECLVTSLEPGVPDGVPSVEVDVEGEKVQLGLKRA